MIDSTYKMETGNESYFIAYVELASFDEVKYFIKKIKNGEYDGEVNFYFSHKKIHINKGEIYDILPLSLKEITIQTNEVNGYKAAVFIDDISNSEYDKWILGPCGTSGEFEEFTGDGFYCHKYDFNDSVSVYFGINPEKIDIYKSILNADLVSVNEGEEILFIDPFELDIYGYEDMEDLIYDIYDYPASFVHNPDLHPCGNFVIVPLNIKDVWSFIPAYDKTQVLVYEWDGQSKKLNLLYDTQYTGLGLLYIQERNGESRLIFGAKFKFYNNGQ